MYAFLVPLVIAIALDLLSLGRLDAVANTSMNVLGLRIVSVSPSGTVAVEVENTSKETIRMWRESNSWGAARWRILVLRKGSVEVFFQNPDQRFTRNIPVPDEIAAGARVQHLLDLNAGNWCGFGHCSAHDQRGIGGQTVAFGREDSVIVVYDVPRTEEAVHQRVWYGEVAALTTVK